MGADTRFSRRGFLKAGATVGAGLTVAFYIPSRLVERLGPAPSSAPFAPNGWVHIGTDGIVTITVDKSEMGQGVNTALPMIVAEELEVQMSSVRVGPTPENPAAWSRRMGTGGSSSVRRSYDTLREAGAAAREMLLAAAAQQWGVDPSGCRAEDGAVIHAASGRKLAYGELVERAARLPVPSDPPLKDPKDFRLLGKPVPRLDTPEKVNGAARFGIDVRLPGMLYVSIERSAVFGGTVKKVDASRAKAVPGVKRVVTVGWSPDEEKASRAQQGVAVVADHYWQAVTGRRALSIDWNEGANALLSSEEISAKLAELSAKPGVQARTEGNAAAAMAGAAKKIEAIYEVPYLATPRWSR